MNNKTCCVLVSCLFRNRSHYSRNKLGFLSHQLRFRSEYFEAEKEKMWQAGRKCKSRTDAYKERIQNVSGSSYVYICVLSTGSQGLGRSVLLKTLYDRYLFNAGEGIQKTLPECVPKVGIVYNTFVTHTTWDNIGGLFGVLLSSVENNIPTSSLLVHGPDDVDVVFDMTNIFTESREKATIDKRGIQDKQYEDNEVVIDYVEFYHDESRKMLHPSSSNPGASEKSTFMSSNEKTVMAYIIKLKDPLPRVDVEKLNALGVPRGPWIKKITEMQTVTLEDGRVIRPEDILMKAEELGPIIILDCPSLSYLKSMISNEQLIDIETKYKCQPHMIVHMGPCEVVNNSEYKTFMNRFDKTIHLMLNEDSVGPFFVKSHQRQALLNLINPNIFPEMPPVCDELPQPQTGNVIQGTYGLKYKIRPEKTRGFEWETALYCNKSDVLEEAKQDAAKSAMSLVSLLNDPMEANYWHEFNESCIDEELEKFRAKAAEVENDKDLSKEYPELTFLGTGSAKPSSSRNASCILVQMRKDEYLMLDCGEGTLIQLYQLFGREKADDILSKLKGVFISHLHYDHLGGLLGIAEARERVIQREKRQDPLIVLAPRSLKKWDFYYSTKILRRRSPIQFLFFNEDHFSSMGKQILDLSECEAVPVIHTISSCGLMIKHLDGWKLVYSGDCVPSQTLIDAGKDCDILIHEGTFGDSQMEHAIVKKHCTTSQALDVAKKMNAKFTMLTHFSQKFRYIPTFNEKFTDDVGFSFDFLQIRPNQFKLLPFMKPLLHNLFGAQTRRKDSSDHSVTYKVSTDKKKKKAFIKGSLTLMKQALLKNEEEKKTKYRKHTELDKEFNDYSDTHQNKNAESKRSEAGGSRYESEVNTKRKMSHQETDLKKPRINDVQVTMNKL